MWEKEKLLIMSNFSFSNSVFKRLLLQTRKNQGLFGKGLTLDHTIPTLNDPEEESFRKTTVEQEENEVTSISFFSYSVFYSIKKKKKLSFLRPLILVCIYF